ncbi:hypothetical protein KUCAC02_001619 [Chaenocephalus aceratus]|uniref:Uncharacterized protein n=1 Tax=Chaenocephalus aceratus TaxID=36190 RepID=A0ACB9XRW0_CHAAC|nr:hypothetical protein KUCAC02_001619 [Chaenocephalus aceratus]
MQELESEMDKVKIISHPQSALAYPSYHSQQFTAYQSRYSSLPQLELCSPTNQRMEETEETRNTTFCGNIATAEPAAPDLTLFKSWSELLEVTYQSMHGADAPRMTASSRLETEVVLLKRAQQESFPAETTVQSGKQLSPSSCLLPLSAVYDQAVGLIRVGGRLRKAEKYLKEDTIL